MFCNFYLAKSHKIASDSATTEAGEKISTGLESVEFYTILTKFENDQILFNKISHSFLMTTEPFTGQKSLIGLSVPEITFSGQLRIETERGSVQKYMCVCVTEKSSIPHCYTQLSRL